MTTPASLLHSKAFLSLLAIDEAVQRALNEDLGRAGDITSIATIPEATQAHAVLIARQAGVIAGLPLAVAVFQKLSPDINIQAHFRDGGTVASGVHVLTISGPARAVLAGERTALN
ncbi:MAG TPA: nicotinate-nucleotide diphosphorylase (carboxylating), partial [Xanthobacteraceae bacterium]